MSREIRREIVRLELYIINDEQYTDYEVGEILDKCPNTQRWYEYENEMMEDIYDICYDIARKLYKTITGKYKCILEIELKYTYSYDYFDGWDEDLYWDYKVISKEETDYWEEN